eukprot:3755077-Prymnesium_polylepis.2
MITSAANTTSQRSAPPASAPLEPCPRVRLRCAPDSQRREACGPLFLHVKDERVARQTTRRGKHTRLAADGVRSRYLPLAFSFAAFSAAACLSRNSWSTGGLKRSTSSSSMPYELRARDASTA